MIVSAISRYLRQVFFFTIKIRLKLLNLGGSKLPIYYFNDTQTKQFIKCKIIIFFLFHHWWPIFTEIEISKLEYFNRNKKIERYLKTIISYIGISITRSISTYTSSLARLVGIGTLLIVKIFCS